MKRAKRTRRKISVLLMITVLLVASAAAMTAGEAEEIRIGSTVFFGHYPQTVSGIDQTPIEWLVLDVQDGNALLISRFGLEMRSYNDPDYEMKYAWHQCQIRTWLNEGFLHSAFTAKETEAILMTKVDNGKSQGYSLWQASKKGGPNTEDQVFLLSYAEANRYLGANDGGGDLRARVAPTEYAISRGAWTSEELQTADGLPAGKWWLRGLADTEATVIEVTGSGTIMQGTPSSGGRVARPALWLNPESEIFQSENP